MVYVFCSYALKIPTKFYSLKLLFSVPIFNFIYMLLGRLTISNLT